MRSIISACILAVCIAAQNEDDMPIVIAPPPADKETVCSNGQLGGCVIPPDQPRDRDDLPDKLCSAGDLNCRNRDAGNDRRNRDDLPDKLCSNGQFGCHSFDDDKDEDSVINIYDDWFNSAVGLRTTAFTAIAIGSSSVFMLAF